MSRRLREGGDEGDEGGKKGWREGGGGIICVMTLTMAWNGCIIRKGTERSRVVESGEKWPTRVIWPLLKYQAYGTAIFLTSIGTSTSAYAEAVILWRQWM